MKATNITRIAGVLLLLLGLGQAAFAQGGKRWVYLGQTTVNGGRDFDRIGIGRAEGRFQSIQLRVSGGPVEFQRVVVNYSNGSSVRRREFLFMGWTSSDVPFHGPISGRRQ
jgi:hypothetical protein